MKICDIFVLLLLVGGVVEVDVGYGSVLILWVGSVGVGWCCWLVGLFCYYMVFVLVGFYL